MGAAICGIHLAFCGFLFACKYPIVVDNNDEYAKSSQVPRKFVLAIGEEWFSNDFKLFPNKWHDFSTPFGVLLASIATILGIAGHGPPRSLPSTQISRRRRSSVAAVGAKSLTIGGQFLKVVNRFSVLCWFLVVSTISTVIRATSAASIALLNTIVWVAIVFAAATPMILSGLYEASLDRNVIKDIRASLLTAELWRAKSEDEQKLDRAGKLQDDAKRKHYHERVHYLYAVLVGNLILPHQESDSAGNTKKAPTVWDDVNSLVQRKRASDSPGAQEQTFNFVESIVQHKEITATRLKGMLGCQISFGTAVGAPIVFFLGSFLFSVISNYSSLGENNTSHALAFGMWWMTIPHVAIVSGLLLAGNNPNILEVIVIGAVDPKKHDKSLKRMGSGRWYQPFYDTAYTPVWMLERGRNKQQWIDRIADSYPSREDTHDSHRRRRNFRLEWTDWLEIAIIAIVLVIFPYALALITSYNTPRVGLACRSLTFTLYFIMQFCYALLWLWDFFYPHHLHDHPGIKRQSIHLDRLYFVLSTLVMLGSGFTAVVGTLLQVVGVYRNCLCAMPVRHWLKKDSFIVLSGNSRTAIRLAKEYWLPTGIASIVLLVMTCYAGWWYQRHWREQFRGVVDLLCNAVDGEELMEKSVSRVVVIDTERRGGSSDESRVQHSREYSPFMSGGSGVSDGVSNLSPSPGGSRGRSIARKPVGESPRPRGALDAA